MLALLLFATRFSMAYPFEKTLSGLGREGCLQGSAFLACCWGWGWADKSQEKWTEN